MPEYDHEHVMTWAEYWALMDPFQAVVTLLVLGGLFWALVLTTDLCIRALMKERP